MSTEPEELDGVLVLSRMLNGNATSVRIEIERRADGSAELRVFQWLDPIARFADERVVPLPRETYVAIERALFEPVDMASYVAAGTHVPCLDCAGEPSHRCRRCCRMRCCRTGIVGSA